MADKRNPRRANNGLTLPSTKSRTVASGDVFIPIGSDLDIIIARQKGREMVAGMGFSSTDLTLIATAISELARNIVQYAKSGEIILRPIQQSDKKGIAVVAQDEGPGITDVPRALQDGYSTSRSLGLGLPGVRRLMDEFEIVSQVNRGTTVTVKKWRQ
ncbi:MAG: anti-sigma regulatory factor [Terriglobia bacterium]